MRSFASAEYTRGYNQINHYSSVEGDQALLTWININQAKYVDVTESPLQLFTNLLQYAALIILLIF